MLRTNLISMLVSYKNVVCLYFIVLIHIVQFAGAVRACSDAMGATGIHGTRSHVDLARNPWQLVHSNIKE